MSKKQQVPAVCHGHSRPIVEVNYSPVTPDGYFLVSASKDGQPMLREGATGDWIGTFQGHKGAVWSCAINDTALLAATGSADFTACLWDPISGERKTQLQHKHIVRTVNFSHHTDKLLTGGMEKLIRIYDCNQPESEPTVIQGALSNIRCTAWIQHDNLILTSYLDKPAISVFDIRSGQEVTTMQTGAEVTSIEVSFDGNYITSTDGKSVKFWSTSNLQQLKEFTLPYTVESASFCPAKRRFVAGGDDMWVRLYNAETGAELEVLKGHHGPVHTVRFGPEGKEYASGSEDGTIRIWQTDYLSEEAPESNGAA